MNKSATARSKGKCILNLFSKSIYPLIHSFNRYLQYSLDNANIMPGMKDKS